MTTNNQLYKRRYIIIGGISTVVFIYILRLFSLQVINTEYSIKADNNAFLHRSVYPSRGLIYDRNNKLLAYNQPAYDVMLIMREMKHDFDTLAFCQALKIDIEYFNTRILEIKDRKKNRGYSAYTPQFFMKQVEPEDIAQLQQNIYKFSGTYLQNRDLRDYNYPYAAHILGSITEVSSKTIKKDPYYKAGDFGGISGLESVYEKQLRGEKGLEIFLRDSHGRIQGKYKNGEQDIEPKSGENLTISIDIELQKIAELLLNGKRGSIVAIEPKTGEILALASSPTWDPKVLTGKNAPHNYLDLLNDKTKPLYNRGTQAQYSPGSTFKINQALIALQEEVINTKTRFQCQAQSSQPIRCTHYHGERIDLINAIEQSCNPYFWQTFKRILEKNGYGERNADFKKQYRVWRDYILAFGYGASLKNTDIYEQSSGYIPTEDFYQRYYGETGWKAITIRSLAIGQGEILSTPLQMANSITAIANEGYYITPHFSREISMKWEKKVINIDKENFKTVKEGMYSFFENTNGKYYKIDSIALCGKTGTVQNPHGKDHSLFVGFAPKENPTIALAVVVENAGFGATWAMPIGSLVMEKYLKGEISRTYLFDRISNTIIDDNVKKH